MATFELSDAVKNYGATLAVIEECAKTKTSLSPQQVLDVLIARDEVFAVLTSKTQISKEILLKIIHLDERLKKQANLITKEVKLSDWRASLHPPAEAWWWFLEPTSNRWSNLNWLWNTLSFVSLTASLSLVVDISSRFVTGVPDTLGAFTITTQSILTLLAAGGALTKTGQEEIEHFLGMLNIPKHFQNVVKSGFALIILLSLTGLRFSLPQIATFYRYQGHEEFRNGRLANAQSNYNRTIKLNPDDWEAHFNLGQIYEQLQDLNRARSSYQIALQGDYEPAYNNLARLYIFDKKYGAAIDLLKAAKWRTKDSTDKNLQYFILKNLGWARLGQKRYAEAEVYLQEAADLRKNEPAAYCLMAQVMEQQNEKEKAKIQWENCLAYATSDNPDEDKWIGLANQCLKNRQCLTIKGDK